MPPSRAGGEALRTGRTFNCLDTNGNVSINWSQNRKDREWKVSWMINCTEVKFVDVKSRIYASTVVPPSDVESSIITHTRHCIRTCEQDWSTHRSPSQIFPIYLTHTHTKRETHTGYFSNAYCCCYLWCWFEKNLNPNSGCLPHKFRSLFVQIMWRDCYV